MNSLIRYNHRYRGVTESIKINTAALQTLHDAKHILTTLEAQSTLIADDSEDLNDTRNDTSAILKRIEQKVMSFE